MPEPSGRIRPTSAASLSIAALIGLALGALVPLFIERSGGIAPTVGWLSVGMLVFWAVVLFACAWSTHRVIHRRRERIPPHRAVNLLVLGKASATAGALVAGAYLGYCLNFVDEMEVALPRERVVHGAVAALVAVLIVVGGLLLEWACRVPKDRDDEPPDHSG